MAKPYLTYRETKSAAMCGKTNSSGTLSSNLFSLTVFLIERVNTLKIAIMGYGVVGSGVAALLKKNAGIIKENTGAELELKRILDIRSFEGDEFSALMTKDFSDIENDSEIDVVVETMGGLNPAFDFVSRCLKKKKHVVSSNKELVAEKGSELLALAEENNVNFLFEASVGGGIPIIRPLTRCLAGNRISALAGILNGTTNFIMTKMITERSDFASALALAQKLGYAEKDPTADVEGIDACRKICILASLAFGSHISPSCVHTEGITKITLSDVEFADRFGYVIKLIAQAKMLENGKALVMVSPALVKKSSMLSMVNDVFNACLVRGDQTGDVLLYGKGAGKSATASAVVGDIIDCFDNSEKRKVFGWKKEACGLVEDYLKVPVRLFVRANESEKEKALAAFKGTDLLQNAEKGELAFITDEKPEGELRDALAAADIEALSILRVTDY